MIDVEMVGKLRLISLFETRYGDGDNLSCYFDRRQSSSERAVSYTS